MKPIPPADVLRKLLRYEPETGKLYWRPRPVEMFRAGFHTAAHAHAVWNTRYADKEAFTSCNGNGYRQGKLPSGMALAHRVIWAMQTGKWPAAEIDHRDCDKTNNAWDNLRQATRLENACNLLPRAGTSSGLKGVTWCKRRGKWLAQIAKDGGRVQLGYFGTPEAAHASYCAAATQMHGNFARTQ